MIGKLTLEQIREAFRRGQTPEQVARAAGVARQTLIARLACRGLRPIHRWHLELITPSEDACAAIGRTDSPGGY
jgi:hypothetical protein